MLTKVWQDILLVWKSFNYDNVKDGKDCVCAVGLQLKYLSMVRIFLYCFFLVLLLAFKTDHIYQQECFIKSYILVH